MAWSIVEEDVAEVEVVVEVDALLAVTVAQAVP